MSVPDSDFEPREVPTRSPANSSHDPWEDTETAHIREFLKLTYTERFNLLMHVIEFMNMLRPPASESSSPSDTDA